jgi:macrolide-specific efflux system membrane fusion protein
VLTVPTTAVEGGSGTGVVYLVGADGATEPREVTLGLSDGISVEVTGGLAEGDMILQFVPGAPADPGMIDPGMGEGGFVEIEG